LDAEAVQAMPDVLSHAFLTGDQGTTLTAAGALRRTKTVPDEVAQAITQAAHEGRWPKAIEANVTRIAGV
jgi:hypothetical protein